MKKALNLKDKNFKKKVIATLITILSIIAIRVDCPYFDGIIIIVTWLIELFESFTITRLTVPTVSLVV